MHRALFPIVVASLVVPRLVAQVVSVPDSNAAIGTINIVPLGGKAAGQTQDIRTQILVPKSALPAVGSKIRELAFAAASVGKYQYQSCRIQLAHLPDARAGTLSATFAQNLSGAVTVLDKTPFTYEFKVADSWQRVGLTSPFLHDGNHDLVVDIEIRGAFFNGTSPGSRRSSTLETVYALGYDGKMTTGYGPFLAGAKLQFTLDNGSLLYVGTGCKASNGKAPLLTFDVPPALGGKTTATVDDVAPSLATLLFFGTSDQAYGAWKLPFALDGIGATGCTLRTDVLLIFGATASASGSAQFQLVFPSDPKFSGVTVTAQGVVLDAKANAPGLVTSRLGKARL
ncbi:MAG: hypothetical protein H6832_12920 [Planctomycetes bacterium]|nr:hypothetical protein [Planctomycetota bacterium]